MGLQFMRKLHFLLSFVLLLSLVSPVWASADHPANKQWTITFSMDVDAKTVNNSTVYVMDENGNKLDQPLTVENRKVIVHAPINLYKAGNYVLHVENNVKSITGEVLKAGQTKAFLIQDSSIDNSVENTELFRQEFLRLINEE